MLEERRSRMKIRSIEVRRFRSIEKASLRACGGLNVLIGKNNAGKSNVLAAIELVHRHLQGAAIAGVWPTRRPLDEFTDRQANAPLQIGIEFDLPQEINESLRQRLQVEAPHLDRSIEQIKTIDSLAMVVAGVLMDGKAFLFLQQLVAGTLVSTRSELGTEGIALLSVPAAVAKELFAFRQESASLRDELRVIGRLDEPGRVEALLQSRETEGRYYLEAILGPRSSPDGKTSTLSVGNIRQQRRRAQKQTVCPGWRHPRKDRGIGPSGN